MESLKNYVWLQGLGACKGKPAGDLQVGDVLGWNGGSTSTVVALSNPSAKTILVTTEWVAFDGTTKRSEMRMRVSRAVAIVENGKFTVANVTKEAFDLLR